MAIREGRIGTAIIVEIKGANAVDFALVNFSKETRKTAKDFFGKMLIVIRKEIKKEVPVDTGSLRRSIKILDSKKRKNDFEGTVGPDGSAVNRSGQSYAHFVIFGTFKTEPNNFMKRGVDNSLPKIDFLIKQMGAKIRSNISKVRRI